MKKILLVICILTQDSIKADSIESTDSNKNKLIVKCANFHLESCEILAQNLPSVKMCDVQKECEFSGWLLSQLQDYNASLPYLQKACENKHFEACNKLGFSFQRLNNYKKAQKYYNIACEKNNINACFNLAALYMDGLGVFKSYDKANNLYEKICNQGEGIGCLHLGLSYLNGNGVFKDNTKALKYFQKACDLGNNKGCIMFDKYEDDE